MIYQKGSPSLFRDGVDPAAAPVLIILRTSHLASLSGAYFPLLKTSENV